MADRASGALEGSDSRGSRGRWFAIGADAGFAVAGVMGSLATYNFIKDPLPESSVKLGKLQEFDDPLKARPAARLERRSTSSVAARERAPALQLTPSASAARGSSVLGGSL